MNGPAGPRREAAKHISAERLEDAPDIRWRDIAGLRDIIAHEYFRIQKQITEDTDRRDLPQLLRTRPTPGRMQRVAQCVWFDPFSWSSRERNSFRIGEVFDLL